MIQEEYFSVSYHTLASKIIMPPLSCYNIYKTTLTNLYSYWHLDGQLLVYAELPIVCVLSLICLDKYDKQDVQVTD